MSLVFLDRLKQILSSGVIRSVITGETSDGKSIPLLVDADGRLIINVGADSIGLAKEETLSNIKSILYDDIYSVVYYGLYDFENDLYLIDYAREIRDRLPSSLTANGNFKVALVEDAIGVARESTLSNVLSTLQSGLYDSASGTYLITYVKDIRDRLPSSLTSNGNFKIAIEEDNVGVAKETTLSNVLSTLQSGLYDSTTNMYLIQYIRDIWNRLPPALTASGNFKVAIAEDLVGVAKDVTVQEIVNRLPSSLTTNGNFKVAIAEDDVELAKDATVQAISNKLPASLTANGNFKIAIMEDYANLAKDGTLAMVYDTLRNTVTSQANTCARLGNVLSINNIGLFKPYAEGATLTPTTYEVENLPEPPVHPPNTYPVQQIFKFTIAPGGTVRIIYPFMIQAIKPYVCYVSFYATSDINVKAWISVGNIGSRRNVWAFKDSSGNEYYFIYSGNIWNRLCLLWTGEFHYGQPAFVIEFNNPSSTSYVTVYVSPLFVSLLDPEARGVVVLFGSESNIKGIAGITSGSTYTMIIDVPIRYIEEQVEFGMCAVIAGDGTNATRVTVKDIISGGVTILDVSNANTTPQLFGQGFAVYWKKLMSLANFQMLRLEITLVPYGNTPLTGLMLYYYGVSGVVETYYEESGTIPAGGTVIVDARKYLGHFHGITLSITTNSSATQGVDIYIPTPFGEQLISTVPPAQTNWIFSYANRIPYVKLVNKDTTYSATYKAYTYGFVRALLQ